MEILLFGLLILALLSPFLLWIVGLKKESDGIAYLVVGSCFAALFWVSVLCGLLGLSTRIAIILAVAVAAGLIRFSFLLCSTKGLFWRKTLKLPRNDKKRSAQYLGTLLRVLSESQDATLPDCKKALMDSVYRSAVNNIGGYLDTLHDLPDPSTQDAYEYSVCRQAFRLAHSFLSHIDQHLVSDGLTPDGQQCQQICIAIVQRLHADGQINDEEYDNLCFDLVDESRLSTIDYFYP